LSIYSIAGFFKINMKKISLVVCVFLMVELVHAQHEKQNGLEISAFRNAGNSPDLESTMLIHGINVTYSRYIFKRWNIGAGFGFGDFNGRGFNGLLEGFYEFSDKRNYTHYHIRLGFEPIQKEKFALGIQGEFLRFSYNGISEIIIGGPGLPGDDPRRVTLGRAHVSGGFFGPYGIFNISESFFLRGNYLIGVPVLNYDWRWTNISFGVGYRF